MNERETSPAAAAGPAAPITILAAPVVTSVSPNSGGSGGGTIVTITGSGFTGATQVRFGATMAPSFTVISDTQITATTPPGTGTVQVTVTTTGGTSSQFVTFTYVNVPVPTLTSISPNTGPAGGGTTVILTGTNLNGATAVKFGATNATSFTVNSSTQITAVSPAGSGTVPVTVQTPGGTSNGINFTYVSAPVITSISPTSGPLAGGNTVTITGTGFTSATAVSFGGTPATSFTVNSATQITATAPAHAAGSVNLTVTGPGGTSNAVVYTYVGAPVLTSLVPNSGPAVGGNVITINGSGFTGATQVLFGGTPAAFTIISPTQIQATAPAGSGTVNVTVVGPGGTSNALPYTYINAPVITSLSPSSGPTSGGNTVTITGTGFTSATAVSFGGTPATFIVNSATQITATAPAHAAGAVNVTVTGPGGTSNAVPYTYVGAPTITSVVPNTGPLAGGNTVTITGTGFTGATAVTFGPNPATSFTIVSPTQITATAPAGTGTVNVTVTGPGGTSNAVPYTYVGAPTITSVVPNTGPLTGGNTVTITGTGFTGATAVTFGPNPATSFTVVSPTQITAVVPAGTGTVNVTVTTPGGTSNAVPYTYVAAPTITSISPASGPTSGGNIVTITGTGFTGATAVNFGPNPATSFTIDSPTQITATAPAGTGTVNVTVTGPGGTSNAVPYTYVAAPTITSVVPNTGPLAGGNTVTITGTGFTGATAVNFGPNPATFTIDSPTQITATAPAGTGSVNVTVTGPGGTSNAVPYTYVAAPTITSVVPNTGPLAGGNTVTITGTGFGGATAVNFGPNPATSFTVVSATQITAVVPAGTGTVNVTVTGPGGTSNAVSYTYVGAPTITSLSPDAGPLTGGNTVTITGTNFTPGATVQFGANPATSVTFVSSTQLDVVVPATGVPGSVPVSVTTAGGTSAPGVFYFYVAGPVVSSISPDEGPIAGGTVVTITGTGFSGATAVTFDGIPAVSFTVDSATQITAVTPGHTAGAASVIVTGPGGTSPAGVSFLYVDPPTLTSVVPPAGPLGGATVTLTGTGLTLTSQVLFGASPAAFTVLSDTQVTATDPGGAAGPVAITAVTPGGTSNAVTYTRVAPPSI
ncbi:beta strand repeat-containing protein [Streptomyces pathocidini]|uniref:Beta strand repeat-containing protein n=1 Tax=Streptomyces pathocidini TaxID=1650571 RepID=A0ABW7UPK3_9ACTN|nr:IPT/TIG domain-containing protein [Streptomyces pathocidini]